MLKACWDCLVGNGTRTEEPYDIQLNENVNRAPPWPTPQLKNEKMFILPKILDTNDRIIIKGITFTEPRQLTIGLVTGSSSPDHSNVACQVNIDFGDKIAIQIIENGYAETVNDANVASDYFTDEQTFEVHFFVRSTEALAVYVGSSYLETVTLKHHVNDIRYLTVHGDVERVSRLDFKFG